MPSHKVKAFQEERKKALVFTGWDFSTKEAGQRWIKLDKKNNWRLILGRPSRQFEAATGREAGNRNACRATEQSRNRQRADVVSCAQWVLC